MSADFASQVHLGITGIGIPFVIWVLWKRWWLMSLAVASLGLRVASAFTEFFRDEFFFGLGILSLGLTALLAAKPISR